MMLNIGIVSGEILELFDEMKGPLTVKEIEVALKQPEKDLLMSLGWLIREGFITMECVGEIAFFRCHQQKIQLQESKHQQVGC